MFVINNPRVMLNSVGIEHEFFVVQYHNPHVVQLLTELDSSLVAANCYKHSIPNGIENSKSDVILKINSIPSGIEKLWGT